MASLQPHEAETDMLEHSHANANPMFVSPETLVLNHELKCFRNGETSHRQPQRTATFGQTQPTTHHQAVWASQTQQQRPSLPMHTAPVPGWSLPTQIALHSQLPPTPLSPFKPLRAFSEDEKLAFPCTGSVRECWNTSLCPKHRDDPEAKDQDTNPNTTTPPTHSLPRPQLNPRRRSAPAGDLTPPPAKMKRNHTEPEESDIKMLPFNRTTIGRDSRPPISKGRVPHNLVERRYRDNLNNQIELLRLAIPALKEAVPTSSHFDIDDSSSPRVPSKAVIISTAATYIKDIENERARLMAANKALQEQVSSLQKLLRCDDCNVLQYLNAMHLPTPS